MSYWNFQRDLLPIHEGFALPIHGEMGYTGCMRLNKYIASCGIASRRKADDLIKQGKVFINGNKVIKLATTVDMERDSIVVGGKQCVPRETMIYIALHKPRGYVCTHARFENEKTIFQLLPREYGNLKIAGRLDKDSEGLVLLSNDGDFIYQLTHPKYKHEKEYEVVLDERLEGRDIIRLRKGVRLEEGIAKVDSLKYVSKTKYRLVLHQGWKRQIRRMFETVDRRIIVLKRTREEKMSIGTMPIGRYRKVKRTEIL